MEKSIFILCEGPSEVAIMKILLENDLLIYTELEIEEREPIHVRSADEFEERYLDTYMKEIVVYRIIDSKKKENLNFKLSRAYKDKVRIINCVTSPEIEMLMIIDGGKYKDYSTKFKSKMKAKDYVKIKMGIKNPTYASTINQIFKNPNDLVHAIREYKRVSNNPKDVDSIAVLLKK